MKLDNPKSMILEGVSQKNATRRQSVLQKLFAVWFDAFVYNQIWEDPRVDLEALELDDDSSVLTISSGGCNALNYLLAELNSVTAVDLNRNHIFLLNLKIAALRNLPDHDRFFAFFGRGRSDRAIADYEKFIAPHLDDETRRFWESSSFPGKLIRGPRIAYFSNGGLYEHSRNGYFLRFFHRFARLVGCRPDEVLKAKTADEQARPYEKHVDPFFDSMFIKAVGKLPVTMFGLGIPPQQYGELLKDLNGGSVIDVYRERARRLAVDYPIDENYFAWQAFARKYDTERSIAIPEYLKAENFGKLKSMADRIETKVGSVTAEIANSDRGRFNRFVFLDAQDWMDSAAMTDLWSAIADRSSPGARIIFRTAGSASPIENALPPSLAARFRYEEESSRDLFKRDRASIYGGFHLYVFEG
ncbi:MAG TPA: BtaA family protein [Pyrinomonadaceae bacterium]|nr:BtaA family protein [Pyrinomonadaceae bacterium]